MGHACPEPAAFKSEMVKRISVIFISMMIMAGCIQFRPMDRGKAPLVIPGQFTLYTEAETAVDRWWEEFESPELNGLVEKALSGNFEVRSGWAKVRQAKALAEKSGALQLPAFDYQAGVEKTRINSKSKADTRSRHSEEDALNLGLTAGYEVDLWGRLSAGTRADRLNYRAAFEDLKATAVTVSATVVETWIDILATRKRIDLLKEQIRIHLVQLDLQKLRFSNGKASALDVSQQREALASARSELPLLELTERRLFNSLAVLLGEASFGEITISQTDLPRLIPVPPGGLPADLLAARPDVRAAGLRLRAADWEVAAAQADRLPSLNLSARGIFSSGSLDLLLHNWVAGLAASLTGPVFDGGRREQEEVRTRAVAEERLAAYAKTVAAAIREVEDSLISENRQGEYIRLLKAQLQAARQTRVNARVQYLNGKSDYLSYLVALNSVQRLERQLAGEKAALVKYRVDLYRTLGGDWIGGLVRPEE